MIDAVHYPRLIGARLRELREARGLTGAGLAHVAGFHSQRVSKVELGRGCTPTLNTLARYATALDVGILDILSCLQASPPVAAPPAVAGGLSGTPHAVQQPPRELPAAADLTVTDAPFGLADVRRAVEISAKSIVDGWPASVQAPGSIVGVEPACSDSHGSEATNPGSPPVAVDLPVRTVTFHEGGYGSRSCPSC